MKKDLICVSKKMVFLTVGFIVMLVVLLLINRMNTTKLTKNSEAGFFDCIITYDKSGNKVVRNPQKCCGNKAASSVCVQNVIGAGNFSVDCKTGKITKYSTYQECSLAIQGTQTGVERSAAMGRFVARDNHNAQDKANKKPCPQNSNHKCYIGNCQDYNKIDVKLSEATEYSCPKTQGYDQKCCLIEYATPTPLPEATAAFELDSGTVYKVTATRGIRKNSFFINISPKVSGGSGWGYCDTDTFPIYPVTELTEKGIEFGDMDVFLIPKYDNGVLGFDIKDTLSNKVVLSKYFGSSQVWGIYYNGGWQCYER